MSISYKSLWVFLALPVFWSFYYHHSISVATLSPQGCRMSWMSPSYVVQDGFNTTWTPLARRYSLLLYREVGWDSETVSTPLFLRLICRFPVRSLLDDPLYLSLETLAPHIKCDLSLHQLPDKSMIHPMCVRLTFLLTWSLLISTLVRPSLTVCQV